MNAYDTRKWGVYISGADSILAAKDFHEAVEKSCQINTGTSHALKMGGFDSPYYPITFAKIFIWDEKYHGGHDPEKSNWDDPY